jgi:peptidyl-prolyl cis-trans isomerase C
MQKLPIEPEPDNRQSAAPSAVLPDGPPASPSWRARWRRLLREPLVHFLLIGMALFIGYRALNPAPEAGMRSNVIELTDGDLRQMTVTWLAQGRPAPTPEQMRSLVDSRVREEILVREALALGLDKDDTIIKRRLAQKMEFLAEDLSAVPEPTSAELEAWFKDNAERFALPPRVSFQHLYFSPDRRGASAREDAVRALAKLAGAPANAPAAAELADPFMFQDSYGDRTPEQLVKLFGLRFAQELFKLEPGSWQGPVESGYGWHLVFLDEMTPSRVPAFEEVEADAKSEWIAERRAVSKRKMYEAMRARYRVVLPRTPAQEAAGDSAPLGRTVR